MSAPCLSSIRKRSGGPLGPGRRWLALAAATAFLLPASLSPAHDGEPHDGPEPGDVLPDLIVVEDYLHDTDVVPATGGGRLLRLSTATANVGAGEFRIEGVARGPVDDEQIVEQVIRRDDGSARRRVAGAFAFHPEHRHVHAEAWAVYRVREYGEDGAVGEILVEGEKTSFCVVDLLVHDATLAAYSDRPVFSVCETSVQGLSVGWADLYHRILPDQNLDVTDLADGVYWLEVTVDPDDHFLESDEGNNTARVLVGIGDALLLGPDAYEPNDDVEAVDARIVGAVHSPNLGPADPRLQIDELTIHASGDRDVFKFYANAEGDERSGIAMIFPPQEAVLALELLDSGGAVLERREGFEGSHRISLLGRPPGWYYARASGSRGAISAAYSLVIVPPSNAAPTIEVTSPAGEETRRHSVENYRVEWTASDPEGDAMWVNVLVNEEPVLDGREYLLPGSLRTPAELGFHVLHSASIEPGTYWVYCEVTDGGHTTGAWSRGRITFRGEPVFVRGDCDGDGAVIGRATDAIFLLRFNFIGDAVPPCLAACDANGDGVVRGEVTDALYLLVHNFLGGSPPPPPFFECGHGLLEGDVALGCEISTRNCPR